MDNTVEKEGLVRCDDTISPSPPPSETPGLSLSTGEKIESAVENIEDATTRVLRFLSTASNETLAAIAVGLVASTWMVLGRVGLVLIGALGGIVLHATWEGQSTTAGAVQDARREKGLDVLRRVLDWREKDSKDEEKDEILERLATASPGEGFEDFRGETANALTQLVEAVVRDYVKWWYAPIVPGDESFPSACRRTLTNYLRAISTHLSRKRPADTFVDFLTNSTSIVVVFLNELQNAINESPGRVTATADAVNDYLINNPESSLANIMNDRQQKKKLKMIAEDILENFLDKSVFACDPSRLFLREMFSGVVLEMTLTNISKPEWINGWVVHLLEEGEPDISHAIDVGMGAMSVDGDEANTVEDTVSNTQRKDDKQHQSRMLGAERAMEEAMDEAKRLSALIAEEDRKKLESTSSEDTQTADDALAILTSKSENVNPGRHENDYSTSTEGLTSPLDQLKSDTSRSEPGRNTLGGLPTVDEGRPLHDNASSDDSGGQATPTTGSGSGLSSPKTPAHASSLSFTDFDQILTPSQTSSEIEERPPLPKRAASILTLHNANISVHDDSSPNDKGKLRSKPTSDYWVQIEPESRQYPGWMILRRYADFETLHEVLRRIANISGVAAFIEQHRELPDWRAHTKPSLRGELERYLRDACWYQPLAESEGMKRFLEKDQAQAKESGKGLLGWPTPAAFETMGKGMLDALTAGPKTAAEGTKAAFGGVSGVFGTIGTGLGNLGAKKRDSVQATRPVSMSGPTRSDSSQDLKSHSRGRMSTTSLAKIDSPPASRQGRASEESTRSSRSAIQTSSSRNPPLERSLSYVAIAEDGTERIVPLSGTRESTRSRRSSVSNSREPSRPPSSTGISGTISPRSALENMVLPPPPSDIPDDYMSPTNRPLSRSSSITTHRTTASVAPSIVSPSRTSTSSNRPASIQMSSITGQANPAKPTVKAAKEFSPISEAETRVCVELLFATITELYTLSSAWSLRRTLLTAAKTFLLRPGNPSLLSIQTLIQESLLQPLSTDSGIAAHVLTLRANSMPTEAEFAAWPKEMSTKEKDELRIKARKLMVERGVPTALVGVMGAGATGDAIGRVFDALQDERVLRGLMFGLLLQGVRAVTQ